MFLLHRPAGRELRAVLCSQLEDRGMGWGVTGGQRDGMGWELQGEGSWGQVGGRPSRCRGSWAGNPQQLRGRECIFISVLPTPLFTAHTFLFCSCNCLQGELCRPIGFCTRLCAAPIIWGLTGRQQGVQGKERDMRPSPVSRTSYHGCRAPKSPKCPSCGIPPVLPWDRRGCWHCQAQPHVHSENGEAEPKPGGQHSLEDKIPWWLLLGEPGGK